MFRFFENLVDPYADYVETDVPPRKLWPFLWSFSGQFRGMYRSFKRKCLLTEILLLVPFTVFPRRNGARRIR